MLVIIENRKAKSEYFIEDTFVAGIRLSGGEVKMLRLKRGSLVGAHVRVLGSEAFLLNAQIPLYPFAQEEDYDPKRTRKLLLHKSEILKIQEAQDTKGRAVIPLCIGVVKNHLKVEIGVGRGKKQYERRDELRRRDMAREAEKALKTK